MPGDRRIRGGCLPLVGLGGVSGGGGRRDIWAHTHGGSPLIDRPEWAAEIAFEAGFG